MSHRTIVVVILFFYIMCGHAQNNSCFEARLLSVHDSSILSFCDSIIKNANECFESPMWYKLSVDFDTDTLHLFGTGVQFMDSQFYTNNLHWLRNSVFQFDSNSTGVFVYSDKIFEIAATNISESMISITDSTIMIPRYLRHTSPVFISRDIKFPHYYQCIGIISIKDKEINVIKKICTCDGFRKKRKNHKRNLSKRAFTH